jgi:hypothetical protein
VVLEGASYRLRLLLEEVTPPGRDDGLVMLAGLAEDVAQDTAPYAVLVNGVRYALTDPAATLPRWQATVEALQALPPSRGL